MNKKTKVISILAILIMSSGCYTYKENCAAYSYEENKASTETNEENS